MRAHQKTINTSYLFSQKIIFYLVLSICLVFNTFFSSALPTFAEGANNLNTNGGKRMLTEWRTGKTVTLFRRTLLEVYAEAGETLNLGSSGVDVLPAAGGSIVLADIVIWEPGMIVDKQAASFPTPSYSCKTSQPGKGKMTTRAQELAGPLPNSGGYDPCVYTVPANGIYYIAFYGPDGPNSDANGQAGTIDAPNITSTQASGVSMWDITVRDSNDLEKPGRVFSEYLAMITGGNGTTYQVNSTIYVVTKDGFKYQVDLRGLDPFGFIIYGNSVGYYHPDGKTPLYHDLVATENTLATPLGGVKIAPPSAKIFFDVPDSHIPSTIIPVPQVPTISNISFIGTADDNISIYPTGGEFHYTGNVGGIAEVVVSRDGVDYDPTSPNNRVLRAEKAGGDQYLTWDGRANNGLPFPPGGPYPFKISLHAGEYHFPMLDAENSQLGGPTITLLNPPGGTCPFASCSTAFYDDRGYQTSFGTVGTVNATLPGDTYSKLPPAIDHSDLVLGFETMSTQRAFGDGTSQGFGNWKGLDLWTYFPSSVIVKDLYIIDQPSQDLRLTKVHSGFFSTGTNGGEFIFQVLNTGSTTVSSPVNLVDDVPVGLTPVSAIGDGWNCSLIGQTVNCNHPNTSGLQIGAKLPDLTLVVNVSATTPTVTNTATISNAQDTVAANNTASDTVSILSPTAVTLQTFSAENLFSQDVHLYWQTASEIDVLGFNIYRKSSIEQSYEQINDKLIPAQAPGALMGSDYSWLDPNLESGVTYYYLLEALDLYGLTQVHGPVSVQVNSAANYQLFLPFIRMFNW